MILRSDSVSSGPLVIAFGTLSATLHRKKRLNFHLGKLKRNRQKGELSEDEVLSEDKQKEANNRRE